MKWGEHIAEDRENERKGIEDNLAPFYESARDCARDMASAGYTVEDYDRDAVFLSTSNGFYSVFLERNRDGDYEVGSVDIMEDEDWEL